MAGNLIYILIYDYIIYKKAKKLFRLLAKERSIIIKLD